MWRPKGCETPNVTLDRNPNQLKYLDAIEQRTPSGRWRFRMVSLFAGRRGGKTRIGGVGSAMKTLKYPKSVGWVTAPTYDDLYDFTMPAFFSVFPESFIKEESAEHRTIIAGNDAVVQFRSLDDPERARGPGLDWLWIDEARKISETALDVALPALDDRLGQLFATTTTNGFDWCYRRLWKPALDEEPGFWSCKYRTIDNPIIDPAEIELRRRTMDPKFFAQEYEADFVNFQGSVYDIENAILRTDAQIQRLIPEWPKIDPSRKVFMGIDPGADHPFAMVLVVATEKGLVCIGEYLKRNAPMIETWRGIQRMLSYNPGRPFEPEFYAIDRSAKLIAMEFQQYGITPQGAPNAVFDGIRRVQSWIASEKLFFIESLVPQTIEQMRGYQYDEMYDARGQKRPESVKKINDDLPDALRYALMMWPALPEPVEDRAENGFRDISTLSPNMQWAVERNRSEVRDRAKALEDADGLPDFFGGEQGGDGLPFGEDVESPGEDLGFNAGRFWGFND